MDLLHAMGTNARSGMKARLLRKDKVSLEKEFCIMAAKKTTSRATGKKESAPVAAKKESTPVRNTAIPKAQPAPKVVSHDLIARRAYEISQSPLCGSEHDNWIRAEKELKGLA